MNSSESNHQPNNHLTANGPSVQSVAGIELFHSIQDPVFIVTPQGIIIDANKAALLAASKSRDQAVGRGICEIIHGGRWPHIKCPLEEFLLTCTSRNEDTRLPGLGGEYHLAINPLVDPDGSIRSILLQARSLTTEESRKVETIRTAQLAAIGELAAGVAHEVNNPINGIINYAQLLLDDADKASPQAELLGRIVQEGERIATIIYSLLSFARENENEFKQIDVREVIHSCVALVDHQLKREGIQLDLELAESSCTIVGNYMQLQQVILNTVNNSRYALNERYPESSADKRLQIQCGPLQSEEGKMVRVTVRDFGTGIPQGILDKVFEPFFTSKPAGKGTGLGLSISYGIIKNHGGTLSVDSILNKYTDMIITIPEV